MKPEVMVIPASEVQVGDEVVTWGFVALVEPRPDEGRVGMILSDDGTVAGRQTRTNVPSEQVLAVVRGRLPVTSKSLAQFVLDWLGAEENEVDGGIYVDRRDSLDRVRIDGQVDLLGLATAVRSFIGTGRR